MAQLPPYCSLRTRAILVWFPVIFWFFLSVETASPLPRCYLTVLILFFRFLRVFSRFFSPIQMNVQPKSHRATATGKSSALKKAALFFLFEFSCFPTVISPLPRHRFISASEAFRVVKFAAVSVFASHAATSVLTSFLSNNSV